MSGRSHLAVDRSVLIWKLRLGSCHSVTWMHCLNSALHTFTFSPLCFSCSQPPDSSFQIFRCQYFPRIFRLRPLCMDRPFLCLKEVLAGLLQTLAGNVSLSKSIDLSGFSFSRCCLSPPLFVICSLIVSIVQAILVCLSVCRLRV